MKFVREKWAYGAMYVAGWVLAADPLDKVWGVLQQAATLLGVN